MQPGADAADTMIKETIYLSSEAAKLAALGAKNLAALVWAMVKNREQSPGITKVMKVLTNTQMPKVVQIKPEDRAQFERMAKEAGCIFTPPILRTKGADDQLLNYVFNGETTAQMNLVLEKLGYTKLSMKNLKNAEERADPSERSSSARGHTDGFQSSTMKRDEAGNATGDGPHKRDGPDGGVGAKFSVLMRQNRVSVNAPTPKGGDMAR